MINNIVVALAAFLAGLALGFILLRARAARERAVVADLRSQLSIASADTVQLTELRAQLKGLRHDLRGILSPALLVSDRLLSHETPYVRRAGEVMVRTVERANQRLTETRLDQTVVTQPVVTQAVVDQPGSEEAGVEMPSAPTSAQL
jgi:hypothetical protein